MKLSKILLKQSILVCSVSFVACGPSDSGTEPDETEGLDGDGIAEAPEAPKRWLKNSKLEAKLTRDGSIGELNPDNLKKVKSLVLMLNDWHEEGFEDLAMMPNIESISMGGRLSSLNDQHVKDFCTYKLPNLEDFIVPFSPNITIESIKMVIAAFPSVKKISVIGCDQITKEQCEYMESLVAQLGKRPNFEITGEWNFGK